MLESFSVSAMAKETEPSFFEAARSLHECMPVKCRKVFDAVAAFDALKAIADGIKEGNNQSGALESTLLLAKVKQAEENSPQMASARDYAADFKLVSTHWWLQVASKHAGKGILPACSLLVRMPAINNGS